MNLEELYKQHYYVNSIVHVMTTQKFYISSQRGKSKTFLYEFKIKENEQRAEKSLLTRVDDTFQSLCKTIFRIQICQLNFVTY